MLPARLCTLILQPDRQPNKGTAFQRATCKMNGSNKIRSVLVRAEPSVWSLRNTFHLSPPHGIDLMQCISLAISTMPVDESFNHGVEFHRFKIQFYLVNAVQLALIGV